MRSIPARQPYTANALAAPEPRCLASGMYRPLDQPPDRHLRFQLSRRDLGSHVWATLAELGDGEDDPALPPALRCSAGAREGSGRVLGGRTPLRLSSRPPSLW